MSTLEDKLMGEKTHYYCSSSSEDEDDADSDSDRAKQGPQNGHLTALPDGMIPPQVPRSRSGLSSGDGYSVNTGPKGVLEDWRRFKQLESERKTAQDAERLSLMKKLSLQCANAKEYINGSGAQQNGAASGSGSQAAVDQEIESLMEDDSILQEFMAKRMRETQSTLETAKSKRPTFGRLIYIGHSDAFLDEIDQEHTEVVVIICIHASLTTIQATQSDALIRTLSTLSSQYPSVKFCCLDAATVRMSHNFSVSGVPTLLVYKGGNLLGNFVRITDELGQELHISDLENFLIEHGFLRDKAVPEIMKAEVGIIRQSQPTDSDSE